MLMIKTLLRDYAEIIRLQDFKTTYGKTFNILSCDTDETVLQRALNLRYRVFWEEYGLLPPLPKDVDKYVLQDEYDVRSKHILLLHELTNESAGTLRLILPDDDAPERSFPIQKYCTASLLHTEGKPLTIAEINGACFAPRFRKRFDDGRFLPSFHEQDSKMNVSSGGVKYIRRRIGYAPAGLLCGAFEAALRARITDVVWMVEPTHLWSLDMIGLPYRSLGDKIDVMGGMKPIIFNIKNALDSMRRDQTAVWQIVSDNGRLQDIADRLAQNDWADSLTP